MAILTPECSASNSIGQISRFRVSAMGARLRETCECEDGTYDGHAFEEKVRMAIEAECEARDSRRLEKLVDEAGFRDPGACVEEIMYLEGRSLSKDRTLRLADCDWVGDHRTILIVAASGGGKSYVAQALGVAACRKGHKVPYRRTRGMLEELDAARERGTTPYNEAMSGYASAELLILDDFLLTPVTGPQASDLSDLMAGRERRTATIVASTLVPEQWYLQIPGHALAENVLGRLVNGAIRIMIEGPDMRKHLAASLPEY